jgi:hypothetical protein
MSLAENHHFCSFIFFACPKKTNQKKRQPSLGLPAAYYPALLEKPGAAKLATFSGSDRFQRYSGFFSAARNPPQLKG